MNDSKVCPHCRRELPVGRFGWRDAAHTRRQGWCKVCLRVAIRSARRRSGRDGVEHLRNHYQTGITLCGRRSVGGVAAHFYDEAPTTALPTCKACLAIDEQACIEAETAQHRPRRPFETNPYRQTYIAVVDRLIQEQP